MECETLKRDGDNDIIIEPGEKRVIQIMRASLELKDPSTKEMVDDLMIRRFLRARDMDIDKASALLLKCLSWRRSFMPKGFISPVEIQVELADHKVFCQGHDNQGRPILVVFGSKHKPRTDGLEEFKRLVVYCLDKICSRIPNGLDKFTLIIDLQGWGYAHCDIRGYIAGLSILQDNYPERLGKCYLIHVPYLFMAAWKIIYPFIDEITRKKVNFVANNKIKSTLLLDIDETQIPSIYGGRLPLIPIQQT